MTREYKMIYDIQYHLCWCTKYRYPVLLGEIGLRCRDLLRQIAMAREITVIRGALAPGHIHMLVAAPPTIAASRLVQYLKGRSSRKLQMEYEELRRRYWDQRLWARGYFCSTVGTVTDEIVKKYVKSQTWEDDGGKGFKIVEG